MKSINIGIQLYSVRDEIKELGVDKVFEILRECGCNTVEFAGFYGLTPDEMKAKLEKYGLRPLAAHIKVDDVEANLAYIDALGIEKIYIPSYPRDEMNGEGYAVFLEKVRAVKALLDSRGVAFGYHNHARELEGGVDMLDKMSRPQALLRG